jgi:hypothetical protein
MRPVPQRGQLGAGGGLCFIRKKVFSRAKKRFGGEMKNKTFEARLKNKTSK